jgi:hypothetical protein
MVQACPAGRRVLLAALALTASTLLLAWQLAGGFAGWAYVAIFAGACVPGLPIGFALFGRRHVAGWVAGALLGYALTALALWAPVQLDVINWMALAGSWLATTLIAFTLSWYKPPTLKVPAWTAGASLALILVLLAVPALLWGPFTKIGAYDTDGNRRYRAYFTADFLWHIALTAELSRLESPPRNPYLSRRPLNYYWAYFVLPSFVSRTGILPSIQACLTINAMCAGLLFVAAIFITAWLAVPRAGPVAGAMMVALLGASAEGWHAIGRLWQQGEPLERLRHLNIDAITAWFYHGLTIDGLPRSLWYTPQHAAACALSLIALNVCLYALPHRALLGIFAGLFLGGALIFSPFIGGAFSLIYGVLTIWIAVRARNEWTGVLITAAPAALPVIAALIWCVGSGTFQGAGGAVAFGPSRLAAAAPFMTALLALGPLLALSVPSLFARATFRIDAAVVACAMGFLMFYFVSLTSEPVWIGWRAGQILLVSLPGLAASTIARLSDLDHRLAVLAVTLALCVGLPTTIIDTHNAQDIENHDMGPGFRWTVVIPPDSQSVLDWIRRNTPPDAVVQTSVAPRGRETWTLIPSFAERRLAAGQPISLLRAPEYDELSAQADAMFRTTDAREAADLARRLRIDYIYIDHVEREAFGDAGLAKFSDPRFFEQVFRRGSAAAFAVR